VVLLAWPGPYRRGLPLKLALSLGIGPGIASCLYFLFSLAARPRSRVYWLLEAAVLIALLVAAFLLNKKKLAQASESPIHTAPNGITPFLCAAMLLVLIAASASFVSQSLMQPHGIQDAWNIWNMRARFLFRGGPDWKDLFSPAIYWLNHPDYPFLVTAGVARAWSLTDAETTRVPMVQAALYALGLVAVLFTGLGSRRSWGHGALAALLLASSAWFVLFGAWQIADIPLDFFYASAIFLLVTVLAAPTAPPGMLFLLGLTTGLAAWSKNEGVLFLCALLGLWAAARLWARLPARALVRESASLAFGLLLPAIALFCLKLIAPPNDLFVDQSSGSLLSRLTDLSRYSLTLSYLWQNSLLNFSGFSGWNVPLLPILALFAWLFWPARRPAATRALWIAALCLVVVGAGYFIILIITPHDLLWHLRTAANRLVFHLYPPLLVILFWLLRTPEEVFNLLFNGIKANHANTP
jgi:hypothetical protein